MKVGHSILIVTFVSIFSLLPLAIGVLKRPKFKIGVAFQMKDKLIRDYDTRIEMQKGIHLAKKLFEQKYKVDIELVKHAYGRDLSSVLMEAKKIVKEDYHAVIGAEVSREALAFSDVFEKAKLVFVTPTASNPKVTKNKRYTFSAISSDEQMANQLASYTATKLKPKVLGILRNISNPYPNFLSKTFRKHFESISPKVPVVETTILSDTSDFKSHVEKFKKANVTHLAVLSHQGDFFQFVEEARKHNFHPIYIGSDGWGSSQKVINNLVNQKGGEKFIGFRSSYWSGDPINKFSRIFFREAKVELKKKPNAYNAIGFDTAWMLFTAMYRSIDPKDPDAIVKVIKGFQDLKLTTTQNMSFKLGNAPKKDLHIYKLSEKGIEYQRGHF